MSMNRYGGIAERHRARWPAEQDAATSDQDSFLTTLGEEGARQT